MSKQLLIKIGLNIRREREKKNIPQNKLASKCNFDKSQLSRIEAGKTNLSIFTLARISDALQVAAKKLM